MNFEEYERTYQTRYAEFARTVRNILETAINDAEDVPRPQSIQYRPKEASRLRPKLERRGLMESASIENEIKDLAGVRVIFYTNTDVDKLLNSRLIPRNFQVHWDETRIHHPTKENENQRYQAIHYTASLNEARTALPEYAPFKGLRCEIQIQTILIHAWAETSHDITYNRFQSDGFGGKAMASIEARLTKIMDEYLLPAGYEFKKVQHDFERLMQGKELFDRGALVALDQSTNNNERHDVLVSLHEYVLPNYDDVAAVYPELKVALLRAMEAARSTTVQPIETPFGNLEGKTVQDISKLIMRILCDLRYVDVEATLRALEHIHQLADHADVRKDVEDCVTELARYDLHVWEKVGPAVQLALVNAIETLSADQRLSVWPLLHIVWRECLRSELRGASFSAESVTISTGAIPAGEALRTIRNRSIAGLLEVYDRTPDADERRAIVTSLFYATHGPTQGAYSNELRTIVMGDAKRVADEMTARAAEMPYELIEHIEHNLLYQYRRARHLADAPDDKFDCKELTRAVAASILAFRDIANADNEFVRYKNLVGFETVVPAQWEDEDADFHEVERYRRERIAEYVENVSDETEDEWLVTIERCAATKSNDMATFPLFGDFLVLLAKHNPETAERLLLRANDDMLNFLTAFLKGLYESGDRDIYERAVAQYLESGTQLSALARQWRLSAVDDETRIKTILDKAIAKQDDIAVMECVVAVITRHAEDLGVLIADCFEPGLRYLTARDEARWVNSAWFIREAKTFFAGLPESTAKLVLDNLMSLAQLETHAEYILAYIARGHAAEVWIFLGERIRADEREREDRSRYEAIPYKFHELSKVLAQDAASAVCVTRGLYSPNDTLFQFRGARLLTAVFPTLPDNLAHELIALADAGSDDDIDFSFQVLRAYEGQQTTREVVKELVARLPETDPRLEIAEICLQNFGVVSGEFGFVEAYRKSKAEIATWIVDPRPRVRIFAEQYARRIDQTIAAEQRRAEERKEMRRRHFEEP